MKIVKKSVCILHTQLHCPCILFLTILLGKKQGVKKLLHWHVIADFRQGHHTMYSVYSRAMRYGHLPKYAYYWCPFKKSVQVF